MAVTGDVAKIVCALVVLQISTLAMLYFMADRQAERRNDREIALLERCVPQK